MQIRHGGSPLFSAATRPNHPSQPNEQQQPHFAASGPVWVSGTLGVLTLAAVGALYTPQAKQTGDDLKEGVSYCQQFSQAQDTFKKLEPTLQDVQQVKEALAELQDSGALDAIALIDKDTADKIKKLPKLNDLPNLRDIQQGMEQGADKCSELKSVQKAYEAATSPINQGVAISGMGALIGLSALHNRRSQNKN